MKHKLLLITLFTAEILFISRTGFAIAGNDDAQSRKSTPQVYEFEFKKGWIDSKENNSEKEISQEEDSNIFNTDPNAFDTATNKQDNEQKANNTISERDNDKSESDEKRNRWGALNQDEEY